VIRECRRLQSVGLELGLQLERLVLGFSIDFQKGIKPLLYLTVLLLDSLLVIKTHPLLLVVFSHQFLVALNLHLQSVVLPGDFLILFVKFDLQIADFIL
jgi:hypothetical protein